MKVSVVCPVYNAASTIESFLQSINMQLPGDVEVILIDDHGQDDSIERAKRFMDVHPMANKVVIIDGEKNRGPGGARNLGIDAATGEYVAFIDSDDWADADFLHLLTEAADANCADLACGSISLDYPDGRSVRHHNPSVPTDGLFKGKAKLQFLKHYKSYFTTFVYRRQFLIENDIRFPSTRCAEDSCFLACCLLAAERIAQADEAVYHYVMTPHSVSHQRNPARWRNRIRSWRAVLRFARTKGLYKPYRTILLWLYLKKGWLLALRDFAQILVKKS